MAGDLYWRLSVAASGANYDASDDISSLTIEQKEGAPDRLTANLADPFKVLSHGIQEGMDVEVELGTDDDHAVVFRGRIYKVEGSFPTEQTPTIQLNAYDPSMRMGLRRRSRPFSDKALSEIVTSIASDYFTNLDVDIAQAGDFKFTGNGVRQQEQTDLAFLQELAQTYGCVLYVTASDSDDKFHFIAQDKVMTAKPAVSVYYGRSDVPNRLLSFQSSADVSQIELPRVLSGIDYDTGEMTELTTTVVNDPGLANDEFSSENLAAFAAAQPDKADALNRLIASSPASQQQVRTDLGSFVREATTTFLTEAQQAAVSNNQFSTRLLGMHGSGSTVGIRQLVAQTAIEIGDVGGRFSGKWFLSSVRHILDAQGYRNEFECRR